MLGLGTCCVLFYKYDLGLFTEKYCSLWDDFSLILINQDVLLTKGKNNLLGSMKEFYLVVVVLIDKKPPACQ